MPKPFLSSAGMASAKEPRLLPQKKLSSLLSVIAEWLALASVAIVPLIFLSTTSDQLELPKQIALLVLVSIATLCMLGSMLVNKTLSIRKTVANPIILVLLAAVAVSAFLSKSKYSAIVGGGGQEYQSLITTVLFAALFFVIVNIGEKRPFASRAMFVATVAGGVVSLLALLSFAGIGIIPGAPTTFNLIGSTVVLGLYAAAIVVMSATSFLTELPAGKLALVKRISVGVAGALAMSVAIVINFWPIWTAIIFGLLLVLVFAVVRPQAIRRLGWLAVPMTALVISVLLLVVSVPMPIRAPSEVFPTFGQSFKVASASLFSSPLFGTGPGTFAQDFALHRNVDINQSPLWYVPFDRGISYLNTVAATLGLFGLVAWLAILAVGIWKAAAYLIASRKKEDADWVLALSISTAWLASAIGLAVYGASLATLFLFWVLYAVLIRSTSRGSADVSFESSPRSGLSMTFVFVIIIVFSLAGWFVSGTRLYADAVFMKAVSGERSKDLDKMIEGIEKSVALNSQSDMVLRGLSQAYLLKIQQLAQDEKGDGNERAKSIQSLTAGAIDAANAATRQSPNSVANWSQLGSAYEAVMPYVGGAGDEAIKAYKRAIELDPTSPAHPTGIGRVYLAEANLAAISAGQAKDDAAKEELKKKITENLGKSVDSLNAALKLKSDYAPASYQLALALDGQGKAKEAIEKIEPVAAANPRDVGVGFQLAMLYYRDNQKDKAEAVLKYVISLEPNYANARWILATIYEEQKKWDDAIAQVQEILKTDKENQTVKDRLQKLEDGKAGKVTDKDETKPTLP